ncbi:PREDICTED: protein FANTASTIC FOUR 4 isoform X2 [Tarenaya hassleriana]|uniref:protein FANTASTIC FOUR 4 isoform X2 n=1 Tax=Tarenaya hassleriana TaxID=28532 RepID=UPI00053C3B23|nr:PREDICTED: protein FANTASTIC FOUR 4 isoform X2 [Tarenaya hassleriana]XP_010546872.1 PREDICTED: protein FANTASTIC FOUR 4 isoform X2 [Tarenaya hassleriana]
MFHKLSLSWTALYLHGNPESQNLSGLPRNRNGLPIAILAFCHIKWAEYGISSHSIHDDGECNWEEDEVEDEEERVEPENEIHTAECDLEREVAEEKHDDDEEKQTMSVENHLQRPGRCVEGDQDNRGLLNWDHFCVATS